MHIVRLKNSLAKGLKRMVTKVQWLCKKNEQHHRTVRLVVNVYSSNAQHVVEIGQYFMTKDTEEQFFARACREYTLPRSDDSSQPKGWIQGNTRIGPVLEITTSYLYGKHGIEVRIWSLRKVMDQKNS